MSEQQYRVIADSTTHPDLTSADAAPGDRLVYDVIDDDRWDLVRIERLVPITDEPKRRSFIVTPNNDRYDAFDIEDALINSRSFIPEGVRVHLRPSLPTREQVYQAANDVVYDLAVNDAVVHPLEYRERAILDAVLALLQKGADR